MDEPLEPFADPDLAHEFTETLCAFWREYRDRYTTDAVPAGSLYLLLDSLALVVLGGAD